MSHRISGKANTFKYPFRAGAFFFIGLAASVQATELDVTAYSDTEFTSNARLATTDTKSDVIERLGLDVRLTEERKRFNANANFRLEQEYYLNNTFSEQTNLTTGFGLFNFDLIEDFLDWRTSFTRTQTLSNPAGPDIPDNREERNIFRSGPSINYRINPGSTLQIGANYILVENSDDSAADTKRFDANASYIYQYNSITQFSLNGVYDEIIESDIDDPLQPKSDDEIRNITLNVGMNRLFSKGSFSINAGQNQVRSDTRDTVTGNFFNVILDRDEFFSHQLNLRYSESISDSSIGFDTLEQQLTANPANPGVPGTLESTSTLDIIKRKRIDLSLTRDIDTFQYSLIAFGSDLDYEVQLNDERSIGVTLLGRQRLKEHWTGGISYQQIQQDFIDRPQDGKNITHIYKVETEYQWTRSSSTKGFIAYEQRENDESERREYEDVSVGISLLLKIY